MIISICLCIAFLLNGIEIKLKVQTILNCFFLYIYKWTSLPVKEYKNLILGSQNWAENYCPFNPLLSQLTGHQ